MTHIRLRAAVGVWTAMVIGLVPIAGAPETKQPAKPKPNPGGTAKADPKPASNLDYWLKRTKPDEAKPKKATDDQAAKPEKQDAVITQGRNPFGGGLSFRRSDALPGVLQLSDGKRIPGGLYTTRDTPWKLWVEKERRWRLIPFITVLSIEAVVIEAGMEKEWRWKEMGSDEKVYTGREKPIRRFLWKFHLIDDSYVRGSVKGQPLWIESAGRQKGPFLLHERSAGKYGQTLKQLVYLKRAVISRRAMEQVRKAQQASSRPAGG